MKNILSESNKYDDILHVPRHQSSHRSKMSIRDRSAQFSPFSAVVGHDTAVKEAARHTVEKRELDESQKISINECLGEIDTLLHTTDSVSVDITYFESDTLKTGGTYISTIAQIKKLLVHEGVLLMSDGMRIKIEDIYDLELIEA